MNREKTTKPKRSLHVAVFTDYYLPTLGGIQTSVKAQKEALEEQGHKVTIFCPGHLPSNDISVVRLPTLKRIKPDGYPVAGTAKKVIEHARLEVGQRKDIDIIHAHSDMVTGVAGLVVAKEYGIPSVQTMHGREDVYAVKVLPIPAISSSILTILHSRYIPHRGTRIDATGAQAQSVTARRMWRLMVSHANFADGVIVPSRHFAKKLQRYGVIRPVSIVSNGIEKTVMSKIGHVKPRNYYATKPLKIMWCGRVSPEKRPLEFLQGIKQLTLDVKVDMYGDGVYLKRVQKFIKKNNLGGRITAHGPVDQDIILREMARHHLLVYSSFDFDNQPMVLLEAIATGLPVVYCDPDLGETIPSKGSILSDGPDPTAIANSIKSVIAHPSSIKAMSVAMLESRNAIRQSHQTMSLISVYRKTIQNHNP